MKKFFSFFDSKLLLACLVGNPRNGSHDRFFVTKVPARHGRESVRALHNVEI